MKLLFILLFTISINAQHDFKIESNDLIWQKVYESNLSKEDVFTTLKTSGKFENVEIMGNSIVADIIKFPIDLGGKSRMNFYIYITAYNFAGKAILDFKDGRYRATIKNIQMFEIMSNTRLSVDMIKLETFATRGDEFKPRFENKDTPILQDNFNSLFELNSYDSDW